VLVVDTSAVVDALDLTAYDAAFVALSEALDVPLVTCDRRLAGALGHRGRVELYGGE
jgi:predicted nucleic acid-binding protein